jgi:hypothetical protein
MFLSTRLVGILRWGKTASSCRWSKLLFSSSGSCVALQLQLCLVSYSPRKVEQFSFECCPLSQRSALGSTTYPALRLACHPTPTLSLCASPDLWVLVAPLGGWLVTTHPFQPLLLFLYFTESSALRVQLLTPPSADNFKVLTKWKFVQSFKHSTDMV